jgi:hypothetical protein
MKHVEEHGRGGQATDDNLWPMCIVCWITKARLHTHTENIKYLLFSTATTVKRTRPEVKLPALF